jgi:hypothetical protein
MDGWMSQKQAEGKTDDSETQTQMTQMHRQTQTQMTQMTQIRHGFDEDQAHRRPITC